MPQEYHFPGSTSVFIVNFFLWFPDCLDLHGSSSIFGKPPPPDHFSAQDSALPDDFPQCICPARLYFPSSSCFSTIVIPVYRFSSNSCWPSPGPSAVFLPLPALPFNHFCTFFIPGFIIPVSTLPFYPLTSRLSGLPVLPEELPAHPTPSLSIFLQGHSLLALLFHLSIPTTFQHLLPI